MEVGPVTLRGRHVTLEPLDERHVPGIFEAMQDEEVCRYLAWPPPAALDETRAFIRDARDLMARGQCVVFAQVWNATGAAIGSTRYLDIRPRDRQVEIGSTFLGRGYWRTSANTEAKYLLLRHAFESLGCVRVALKTDGRNTRSQAAIERLGAVREGVLRKHMNVRGFQRDTVYFSILETEWPGVKARLEARLSSEPSVDRRREQVEVHDRDHVSGSG
jgi:RimJ/RimL family protein N-acetyltransferase